MTELLVEVVEGRGGSVVDTGSKVGPKMLSCELSGVLGVELTWALTNSDWAAESGKLVVGPATEATGWSLA